MSLGYNVELYVHISVEGFRSELLSLSHISCHLELVSLLHLFSMCDFQEGLQSSITSSYLGLLLSRSCSSFMMRLQFLFHSYRPVKTRIKGLYYA